MDTFDITTDGKNHIITLVSTSPPKKKKYTNRQDNYASKILPPSSEFPVSSDGKHCEILSLFLYVSETRKEDWYQYTRWGGVQGIQGIQGMV